MKRHPTAVILMGVSGCGKTSVGERLASILDWPFIDGDLFHPPENVAKMSEGIPLDDEDRIPWLANLNALVADHLQASKSMLLACSALKQHYRDMLSAGNPGTVYVYLKGDFNLIFQRMAIRESHYMKAGMLQSQFEALEEPLDAIIVDISQTLDEIVSEVIIRLP